MPRLPDAEQRPRVDTEGAAKITGGRSADQSTRSGPPPVVTDASARPPVYGSSTVKRSRATNAELEALDSAILDVLSDEHPATLRGTYYRVVSMGAVDKTEAGYRQVGRQVLKLRRSGRLPHWWITDGTRYVIRPRTWSDLDAMLRDAAASYRRMLWLDQPVNVQIFTEKDAITGVIEDVCDEWHVPLGVLRGYASESFCWSVAQSLPDDWPTRMYQLGDHDPSGVDAWRDFEKKVRAFAPDAPVQFERIAVTPEQIEIWSLPTRPTKKSDTRAAGFDGGSVEVDAIPPNRLRTIVRQAIEQHVDQRSLELTRSVEASERLVLTNMIGGVR